MKKRLLLVSVRILVRILRFANGAMDLLAALLAPRNVVGERASPECAEYHSHPIVTIATIVALAHSHEEASSRLAEGRYPAPVEKRAQLPVTLEKALACTNIMQGLLRIVQRDLHTFQQEQELLPPEGERQVEQAVQELHAATIVSLAHSLEEAYCSLAEGRYPAPVEKRAQLPVTLERALACVSHLQEALVSAQGDLRAFLQEQGLLPLQEERQVEQVVQELHCEVSQYVEEYMIAFLEP